MDSIYSIDDTILTSISNAIRQKKNESSDIKYLPSEMSEAILNFMMINNFNLIVIIDSGSTVTCTKDTKEITNTEFNGAWYFSDLEPGEWTINCTLGDKQISRTITIVENELCKIVELHYILSVSDFNLSSYGTLGIDYEVVYDDDTEIPQDEWSSTENWKIRLLTSGTITPLNDGEIDVFCVGGGGAGGGGANSDDYHGGTGGGGGYTNTNLDITITSNTSYEIIIGSGGNATPKGTTGNNGGSTSAFNVIADGGKGGISGAIGGYGLNGGDGGSGGGTHGRWGTAGSGGSNGSDGGLATNTGEIGVGGSGQGSTTREFGETTGVLYAGGGGGGGGSEANPGTGGAGGGGSGGAQGSVGNPGTANTGGGGGGGSGSN